MTYFTAHPVTAGMGLRESINAMLEHVAWSQDGFGYDAPCVNEANYRALLRDYPEFVQDTRNRWHCLVLTLVPHIPPTHENDGFPAFVELLVALCNDYPLYDDEEHNKVEEERLTAAVRDTLASKSTTPPTDEEVNAMVRALWEVGNVVHESDGSVYISVDDWTAATHHRNLTTVIAAPPPPDSED